RLLLDPFFDLGAENRLSPRREVHVRRGDARARLHGGAPGPRGAPPGPDHPRAMIYTALALGIYLLIGVSIASWCWFFHARETHGHLGAKTNTTIFLIVAALWPVFAIVRITLKLMDDAQERRLQSEDRH